MPNLKLMALDGEDLDIVSAHVQDAIVKVGDLGWHPREGRFVMAMNRFAWEAAVEDAPRRQGAYERRRACLHFDRVTAVRSCRIARDNPDTVLELLAVRFNETAAPAGEVELVFAGGAGLKLSVECVEAQLSDLGAAWATHVAPVHDLADEA
jgi:hypothetical protein